MSNILELYAHYFGLGMIIILVRMASILDGVCSLFRNDFPRIDTLYAHYFGSCCDKIIS